MGHCLSSEVMPDLSTVSTTPRRSHRATNQSKFHMDEPQDLAIDWSQFQALVPLRQAFFIPPQSIQHVQELPSNMHAACRVYIDGEAITLKAALQDSSDEQEMLQALVREIKHMSRIHHPNIVDFRGFTVVKPFGLCAAFETMQSKSLWDLLCHSTMAARLSWPKQKIQYAIEVCRALEYMHSLRPKLIHRNVKASKVCLNHGYRIAKLSGFDMARNQTFERTMAKAGSSDIQWSAPELLIDGDYSELVDIYAFGVLLVELDTCQVPLQDVARGMSELQLRTVLRTGRLRPAPSAKCPPEVANVIKHCLQFDPRNRPSSSRLLKMLLTAQASLNK